MRKNVKFLFVVQGEGRGHLTQAISLAGILRRNGHEITEVLVGRSNSREVPKFFYEKIGAPVREYEAPSFIFKKDKKHIDPVKTFLHNLNPQKLKIYGESIEMIHKRVMYRKPDVVVNFYELLPGFMQLRYRLDIPFINIGHQYLLLHPDYVHGKGDAQHMTLLRFHALLSSIFASKLLALSFYPMRNRPHDRMTVVPPLLRREILDATSVEGDFILGYMLNQGYENEVRAWHRKNPEVKLHFFWDKKDAPETMGVDDTFTLHRINDERFVDYMRRCRGYITTAGFESVCEALYLNKPVMLIPAHIEQEVNAADAVSIHGGITGNSFDLSKLLEYMDERRTFDAATFREWVVSAEQVFLEQLTKE